MKMQPVVRTSFRRSAALLIVLLGLSYAGVPAAAWIILFAYSLVSVRTAIKGTLYAVMMLFLNPAVFAIPEHATILRWGVIIAGYCRIAIEIVLHPTNLLFSRQVRGASVCFVGFVAAVIASTLVSSELPYVSVLKLTMFGVGAGGMIIAFQMRTIGSSESWLAWLLDITIVVMAISGILAFLPAGYSLNGLGLQGIFHHPQFFGVFLVGPTLYALLSLTDRRSRHSQMILLAVGLLGIGLVFLSQARTALFAIAIALILVPLITMANRDHRVSIRQFLFANYRRVGLLILIGAACVSLLPMLSDDLIAFVAKRERANIFVSEGTIVDRLMVSRASLMERQMSNFRASPVWGIGFGVPSEAEQQNALKQQSFVVSVSSEKGNAFSATLEETGIVGFVAFMSFVATVLYVLARNAALSVTVAVLGVLITNFGEATIFSVGSLGMLTFFLIGIGLRPSKAELSRGCARVGGASPYAYLSNNGCVAESR